jgi:hypothetical protein
VGTNGPPGRPRPLHFPQPGLLLAKARELYLLWQNQLHIQPTPLRMLIRRSPLLIQQSPLHIR